MDQTEGLNDAPGPSDYADTDVPQIPNANHSSIILSRKTLLSLGFLFFFPLSLSLPSPLSHMLTILKTQTQLTLIQAHNMTNCHTHAPSSSKTYCNYLPSGAMQDL